MKEDPSGNPSAWWTNTRAALARMFGHVQVRQLGLDALGLGMPRFQPDAVDWPAPAAGAEENVWFLAAGTQEWQPPAAPAGSGDLDGAVLPCTVSDSLVPHLPESGVHGGAVSVLAPALWAADLGQAAREPQFVRAVSVQMPGGRPCVSPVTLPAPAIWAAAVALSGTSRLKAARDKRSGVPAFAAPRVVARLDRITRLPLLRHRTASRASAGEGKHHLAERQALAASCGVAVEEVTFLASFAQVPLALVQQMAMTPDGEILRLWLRPEALASSAVWTAARVTIVLGQQRLSGETIRTVLPEPQTAGRKR